MKMLFKYTTELRTFFENLPANADSAIPHRQVIENGRRVLFDFEYPIFDPSYKNVFETHFIRRFYMREIGFESFGLFKFQLETWLLIHMPYFNKLYESVLMEYDPLTNSKMLSKYTKKSDKKETENRNATDTHTVRGDTTTTGIRNGTTDNTLTSDTELTSTIEGSSENTLDKDEKGTVADSNFDRQLESNNPDSRLTITANDGKGVIEYASSIKENKETNSKNTTVLGTNTTTETSTVDSTNTGKVKDVGKTTVNDVLTDITAHNITDTKTQSGGNTSNINDIEDFVQERVGKIGVQSYAKLVQEYRSALLNVEKQIFNEMNELFMLVY